MRNGTPDDASRALFRDAVADAVPLESDRIHHEPPPPPPIPRQRAHDEHAALGESLSDNDPLSLALEGGDIHRGVVVISNKSGGRREIIQHRLARAQA